MLNQHLFGEDVVEKRCAVDRRGSVIQVTSTTNSKYQLLRRARGREATGPSSRQLIGD